MERAYRNPHEALRARLSALEKEIDERAARVTRAFWLALPEDDARRLEELLWAAHARTESLDGLLAAQQALEAYRDLFDEALARAPALESELNALPTDAPVPEALVPQYLHGWCAPAVAELGGRLRRLLERYDRDVAVAPYEYHAQVARFVAHGVPFALLAEGIAGGAGGMHFAEVWIAVATSVRRAAPRVRLRPEGWGDALAKALRLRRDPHLDDPEFDAFFHVDAEPDAARRVLNAPVRAALLAIARVDVPTLEVADGAATLRWRFEPTPPAVDAAVRALAGIRSAPLKTALLRGEGGRR